MLGRGRGSANWAQRGEVHTKTTNGQYFSVWLELARLVSSLLSGAHYCMLCLFILCWKKRTSGQLSLEGFRRNVFLMTRQTTTSLKTNLLTINQVEHRHDFKNDLLRNLARVSTAADCWNSEKGILSILEYFNLFITLVIFSILHKFVHKQVDFEFFHVSYK